MSELIDRRALRAAHGLGTDCADCKQDARSCQYDRDFSRMDFCEWIDDAPTVEPASPWHRVEDGLPKPEEIVLACNDVLTVNVAYLASYGKWYAANNTTYDSWTWMPNVTHWMPFPEPPKEE